MRTTLAWATLRRHPARTTLAVLGIAVAAALLLDMVMLATGMRTSFRALMLTRGYQLRIAPKGTLPFDSEATIDGADAIVAALRANPAIKAVSPSLGTTLAMPEQREEQRCTTDLLEVCVHDERGDPPDHRAERAADE